MLYFSPIQPTSFSPIDMTSPALNFAPAFSDQSSLTNSTISTKNNSAISALISIVVLFVTAVFIAIIFFIFFDDPLLSSSPQASQLTNVHDKSQFPTPEELEFLQEIKGHYNPSMRAVYPLFEAMLKEGFFVDHNYINKVSTTTNLLILNHLKDTLTSASEDHRNQLLNAIMVTSKTPEDTSPTKITEHLKSRFPGPGKTVAGACALQIQLLLTEDSFQSLKGAELIEKLLIKLVCLFDPLLVTGGSICPVQAPTVAYDPVQPESVETATFIEVKMGIAMNQSTHKDLFQSLVNWINQPDINLHIPKCVKNRDISEPRAFNELAFTIIKWYIAGENRELLHPFITNDSSDKKNKGELNGLITRIQETLVAQFNKYRDRSSPPKVDITRILPYTFKRLEENQDGLSEHERPFYSILTRKLYSSHYSIQEFKGFQSLMTDFFAPLGTN